MFDQVIGIEGFYKIQFSYNQKLCKIQSFHIYLWMDWNKKKKKHSWLYDLSINKNIRRKKIDFQRYLNTYNQASLEYCEEFEKVTVATLKVMGGRGRAVD